MNGWQWANVKMDKESFAILKQIMNIPKEDMEDDTRQCLHM